MCFSNNTIVSAPVCKACVQDWSASSAAQDLRVSEYANRGHGLIHQGTTEAEDIMFRSALRSIGLQNQSAGKAHALHASFQRQLWNFGNEVDQWKSVAMPEDKSLIDMHT